MQVNHLQDHSGHWLKCTRNALVFHVSQVMSQVIVALLPDHDYRHRWRVPLSLNQREAACTDYQYLTMSMEYVELIPLTHSNKLLDRVTS